MTDKRGELSASKAQNALLILAILAGLVGPALVGWQAPFWLDETYTGVIAGQSSFAQFVDWCLHELSGPVYYLVTWLWAKVAGLENSALRLPSYLFLLATIAIILKSGLQDRRFRLAWAALVSISIPSFLFATQARPQALLILLATVQAILFIKAYRNASRRAYLLWSVVTALLLLTHIYTAIFSGLLFLVLAWRVRDGWQSHWPSILPFAVVLVWMAFHLPFMLNFAQPENAWYPVLALSDISKVARDMFGLAIIGLLFMAIVGAAWIGRFSSKPASKGNDAQLSAEILIFIIALFAIGLIFIAGTIRPFYAGRYLVPFMPAVFLGAAYIVTHSTLMRGWLPVLLVWPCLFLYVIHARTYYPAEAQKTLYPLEFERGSEWLISQGSNRILFAWDNQAAAINSDERLTEVGGFFFRRKQVPVEILIARPKSVGDWNPVLEAQSKAKDADILWVGGSNHPAIIAADPNFICKRFGDPEFSQSMACIRKRSAAVTLP